MRKSEGFFDANPFFIIIILVLGIILGAIWVAFFASFDTDKPEVAQEIHSAFVILEGMPGGIIWPTYGAPAADMAGIFLDDLEGRNYLVYVPWPVAQKYLEERLKR